MPNLPIEGLTFGLDDNQNSALGGFDINGNAVGAKMVPDPDDASIGALAVAVAGGPGPVASNIEGGRLVITAATAINLVAAVGPVSSIVIRNHSGAVPNGNVGPLYIGLTNAVDPTHFIMVLLPGEEFGFAYPDPTEFWVYALAGANICYVYAG